MGNKNVNSCDIIHHKECSFVVWRYNTFPMNGELSTLIMHNFLYFSMWYICIHVSVYFFYQNKTTHYQGRPSKVCWKWELLKKIGIGQETRVCVCLYYLIFMRHNSCCYHILSWYIFCFKRIFIYVWYIPVWIKISKTKRILVCSFRISW